MVLSARFWSKVNKTETCWLWTASLNHHGYGRYRHDGASQLAHRVAYSVLVGPIPDGAQTDHRCHQRRCVNPQHMQIVSPGENQENRAGVRRDSASGVRGVYRDRDGRWEAYARHRGVKHYAGRFGSLDAAADAARALRNRLHSNNLVDQGAH